MSGLQNTLNNQYNLPFKAVKIIENVYWVGAVDWNLKDFHGYSTKRGTTYNAYLIMADKITLVDTVKAPFKDELLSRISSVINPCKIDYIISNHSEMDHSGCLPDIVNIIKPEKVFASQMGVKALNAHFIGNPSVAQIIAVENGSTLKLGNKTIQFLETKMLHWPDSMFSYIIEDKLLFSQDGFGMHLASSKRFADQIPGHILDQEAEKYFANILMPFSKQVLKLIETVTGMNLEFNIIAPDHGPIWRTNCLQIVKKYNEWAIKKPGQKAVVIYDTMWKATELMARAIAEGLSAAGVDVKVMNTSADHRSDIMTELLYAGALIAGSPTINNGLFPAMSDVLCYIKGLKPKNLTGFAFGSYGWSGESVKLVEENLKEMGVELICPAIKCQYSPDSSVLEECYNRGFETGKKLLI